MFFIYIFRNIVAILQTGVMDGCLTGCLHTFLLHAAFFLQLCGTALCHVPCVEMNGSTSTLPSSIINILVHFVSKILAFFVSVVIFYAACS